MLNPAECRLIVDPPCPGPWNMGVDEMLLEWAAGSGRRCWRLYQWGEPTLSLGYFQDCSQRQSHAASASCPAVRRLTGGGAIVHDVELTYSLVVPAGDPLAQDRDALYRTVHASLIDVLAEHGIRAALCSGSDQKSLPEPFLCFQRRAPGDVLVGASKVAGSAQRRRRGAVLQHGSVLLGRSPAAPELAGLRDLAACPLSADQLAEAWLAGLLRRLAVRWIQEALSEAERARATALAETHYPGPY